MKVTLNGNVREYEDGLVVADLILRLGLQGSAFAVELNRQVVPRARLAETPLREGDRLEIVTLVGGG
jgi:sulfur carrier protein